MLWESNAKRTFWFLFNQNYLLRINAHWGGPIFRSKLLTPAAHPFSLYSKFEFLSWWSHLPFSCPRGLPAWTGVPVGARVLPRLWCASSTRTSPHRLWNRATSSGSCRYARSSSMSGEKRRRCGSRLMWVFWAGKVMEGDICPGCAQIQVWRPCATGVRSGAGLEGGWTGCLEQKQVPTFILGWVRCYPKGFIASGAKIYCISVIAGHLCRLILQSVIVQHQIWHIDNFGHKALILFSSSHVIQSSAVLLAKTSCCAQIHGYTLMVQTLYPCVCVWVFNLMYLILLSCCFQKMWLRFRSNKRLHY